MKKLLTILFCTVSIATMAQSWYITFDAADTGYRSLIFIDTINYHHNLWQVGRPNKTVFTAAESAPNAIVTDTLHPYAANDTSVFILKVPGHAFIYSYMHPWFAAIQFSYRLIKDSNSTARLEFSDNSGTYWYNLKDTLPTYAEGWHTINFPDSSLGWDTITLGGLSLGLPPNSVDTFLFRFTFISDSVTTAKDGWMIDDIVLYYFLEGVPNAENKNAISIYPNPSNGNIYIHANSKMVENIEAVIYDMTGREVYATESLPLNRYLNLSLPEGVYVLKYTTREEHFAEPLIIKR